MLQSRRDFLKTSVLLGSALPWILPRTVLGKGGTNIEIGGFTKELQMLSYEETAAIAAQIGWDGIECPVRPGGQVLPEKVEDDLPRMVEALEKKNLKLHVMATSIHNPGEKYTEKILKTAGTLGIKYYRMGWWNYDLSRPIDRQLADIKAQMSDLAALNRHYNITGVYQNHSGGDSVGAAVWDIYQLLNEINSDYLGAHFDIGHATVEGGYAWPIHFQRIKRFIKAVIVKDFKWSYGGAEGAEVIWCPLGEGAIDPEFFDMLREISFEGPVTMHYEYEIRGKEQERIKNLVQSMKKDTDTLRSWIYKQ
jgi:sugar phosphate isomerase/epimerase